MFCAKFITVNKSICNIFFKIILSFILMLEVYTAQFKDNFETVSRKFCSYLVELGASYMI